MTHQKNIPYYVIVGGIFLLMKVWYIYSDTDSMRLLITPVNAIIELITGSSAEYSNAGGYYHSSLHIQIDKSCSGLNFWLLSFMIFSYQALRYPIHQRLRIWIIPSVLLASYLFTTLVNSARIAISLFVQQHTFTLIPNQQDLLHEVAGIITNLTFLVLTYYLLEKYFTSHHTHAKLASSEMDFPR